MLRRCRLQQDISSQDGGMGSRLSILAHLMSLERLQSVVKGLK